MKYLKLITISSLKINIFLFLQWKKIENRKVHWQQYAISSKKKDREFFFILQRIYISIVKIIYCIYIKYQNLYSLHRETLYRGIIPVLQSLCASNFVYFYTFHGLKMLKSQRKQSAGNDLLLASIAGKYVTKK